MDRDFCEGEVGGGSEEDSSSFQTNRIREMNTFELTSLKLVSNNEPSIADDIMLKNVILSNNKEGAEMQGGVLSKTIISPSLGLIQVGLK